MTAAPRLQADYDPALTRASMSALAELALALASYRDSLVLVGGWVPYLLLREHGRGDFAHVGSIDIDLAVDPDGVDGEGYATIVELLEGRGYEGRLSRTGDRLPFSFAKKLPGEWRMFNIQVDLLTSGVIGRHRHRRVQPDLPARIARGCGLAFRHNRTVTIESTLPEGGMAECEFRVLDIPGCIGMKGIVLGERYREKDAYDIYSVVGHCLEGPEDVATAVSGHLGDEELSAGVDVIARRFRTIDAEGPAWVASFLQPTDEMMRERFTADAFVVVGRFMRALRE